MFGQILIALFHNGQELLNHCHMIDVLRLVAQTLESAHDRRGVHQMPTLLAHAVFDDHDGQHARFGERCELGFLVRVHFGERVAKAEIVEIGSHLRTIRTTLVLIDVDFEWKVAVW